MTSVANKIKQFNSGRNPKLLKQKYENMRSNAFVFYRGSCHLFYQDLPAQSFLEQSPASWICGDLHLENFGSYKADNRNIYFDINDFDEGILAPCLFDIARLLTSIILAADVTLKIDPKAAVQLCKSFSNSYAKTLQEGTAQLMDENLAQGALKDFLDDVQNRKRKDFINSRTEKKDGKRKLLIDNKRVIEIGSSEKQQIENTIEAWAKSQKNPEFYQVLDVGYRIAGTGSLGLERYVLLLEGNGDGNHYLLDMKIANPSCLNPYLQLKQPAWKNEAERIVQIQKRMQIFPLALLNPIEFKQRWFVLKELQPCQDSMDFKACKGNVTKLDSVIRNFAEIVAWNQLRSSGRQGSASADELIAFGRSVAQWHENLLDYSLNYAQQVKNDCKEYCEAYDAGYFSD
jgi:uncharacterized protein (DUF2252 family)